jgi:hypothetical protein
MLQFLPYFHPLSVAHGELGNMIFSTWLTLVFESFLILPNLTVSSPLSKGRRLCVIPLVNQACANLVLT